jgi:hypothetical protein
MAIFKQLNMALEEPFSPPNTLTIGRDANSLYLRHLIQSPRHHSLPYRYYQFCYL